ncbi:hypothetical protein J658_0059 [Acinetobacter baumannii 573719]|nr:hypothetical protein J658_0059 [Acinetobacter baumannii 573719]
MIYLVIGLAVLAVTAFIGWFRAKNKFLLHQEMYRNERNAHFQTKLKLNVAEQTVLELSNPPPPSEDTKEESEEIGNFVRTKRMKRATPETYRNVFDLDINGQRVLEHLTMVFCKDPFVADDKGGERQTSYNLGAQGVINFIVNNINQANQPNYKEQDND